MLISPFFMFLERQGDDHLTSLRKKQRRITFGLSLHPLAFTPLQSRNALSTGEEALSMYGPAFSRLMLFGVACCQGVHGLSPIYRPCQAGEALSSAAKFN